MKFIISLFFMVVFLSGCGGPKFLASTHWEGYGLVEKPSVFITSSDFSRAWMAVENVASEMNMKRFISDKSSGILRYSTPHEVWENTTVEANVLLREQPQNKTSVAVHFFYLAQPVKQAPWVQVYPIDGDFENKFIDRLRVELGG